MFVVFKWTIDLFLDELLPGIKSLGATPLHKRDKTPPTLILSRYDHPDTSQLSPGDDSPGNDYPSF